VKGKPAAGIKAEQLSKKKISLGQKTKAVNSPASIIIMASEEEER